MRSTCGVLALLAVCALVMAAAGSEPTSVSQTALPNPEAYSGYAAPACAAPAYGLVPGCCEFAPSCCDTVWDGYCQERHRWEPGMLRGFCWGLRPCRRAPRCATGCQTGCDQPAGGCVAPVD